MEPPTPPARNDPPPPLSPVTIPGQPGPPGHPGIGQPSGLASRSGPPGHPGSAPRRRGNTKLYLIITLGVLFALGVAAAGVLFLVYDRKTEIKRDSPSLVVRQYVDAVFEERDPNRVRLFTCRSGTDLDEMDRLLAQVKDIEARFNVSMTVQAHAITPTVRGDTADVSARISVETPGANGITYTDEQNWRFTVEDRSGWRVCAAHRTP